MFDPEGAHNVLADVLQFAEDFMNCACLSGGQLDGAGWDEWRLQAVEEFGGRGARRFPKGAEVPKPPGGRAGPTDQEIESLLHS
eukprot:2297135-Pyramimonas_sp.AAC.1